MQKTKFWIGRHKKLTTFIVVLFVSFVIIYKPYKPTNPSSPFFVESWFRLSDYNFRPNTLKLDLEKLLPIGTSIEEVDQILVKYGGAQKIDQTEYHEGQYCYTYQPFYLKITPDNWCIRVFFTNNGRLKMIYFGNELINTAPNSYTGE